jgi:Thioredoxin domain
MGEEKVLKISIGGNSVGIAGLEEIFSQARDQQGLNEVQLEKFLLEEAKKKNFIPSKMEGIYARALLKAFKKYCGEEVEEESPGLQVRILGGGCVNCQKLERETLSALGELNLAADFDKEEDPGKIARYGVLGIPALVINGKVKSVGRVPSREQIKKWLGDASAGK